MPATMSPLAGLKEVAAAVPPPSQAETAALIGTLPLKEEAFNAWSPGQTWFAWCSTTSNTVTMGDTAWLAWNNSVTTTTGSLAYNYRSNAAYVSTGTQWVSWNAQAEETEDQRAERERQLAEADARWEERRAEQVREADARQLEREAAQARAEELLLSLLSDEQRATYREHGWFEVRGSSGRRWRVRNRGQSGNVDLMPEIGDVREATFCAHPAERLPDADAHVAQMLALVTDDEAFERTANVRWRAA